MTLRDPRQVPGVDSLAYLLEVQRTEPINADYILTAWCLVEWYNAREPGAEDLKLLADLYAAGRFDAWKCPSCGEWVYEAEPEDWDHFQGVAQNDRVSYPGSGANDNRCDYCRTYSL